MHDLTSVIKAELDAAKHFLSQLKEESRALAAGDTDRLSVIVQKKSELLQNIGHLAQEREKLLPVAQMRDWAREHPEIASDWQDLIVVGQEIKQINEVNGKIIDVRLRATQQSLGMLQSLSRATTYLYGPDGQTSVGVSGNYSIESV